MPARLIARREYAEYRRRCQDFDHNLPRPWRTRVVAVRRPAQQRVAADGEGRALKGNERAIRQALDLASVQAFGAPVQALAVQHFVHFRGARPPAQLVRFAPIFAEKLRVFAAALEARPIAGRESGRLI